MDMYIILLKSMGYLQISKMDTEVINKSKIDSITYSVSYLFNYCNVYLELTWYFL